MPTEVTSTSKRRGTAASLKAKARPAAPVAAAPTGEGVQPASGLAPWHLFVVGGLVAASAAALAVRGTTPANVIFVCLAVFAASGTAYALYRTLWPLVAEEGDYGGPEMVGGRTRAALEREKVLVLRAIKDLEFDRAMGKVSEADFQDMSGRLRTRAIRLIRQLDDGAEGYRVLIGRELRARLGYAASDEGPAVPVREVPDPEPRTDGPVAADVEAVDLGVPSDCPACARPNDPDARFCKQCGTRLGPVA